MNSFGLFSKSVGSNWHNEEFEGHSQSGQFHFEPKWHLVFSSTLTMTDIIIL